MDSIDYFDKRNSKTKEKKSLEAEWNELKKVQAGQNLKNKVKSEGNTPVEPQPVEPQKEGD